jgi:hypothetical protein
MIYVETRIECLLLEIKLIWRNDRLPVVVLKHMGTERILSEYIEGSSQNAGQPIDGSLAAGSDGCCASTKLVLFCGNISLLQP